MSLAIYAKVESGVFEQLEGFFHRREWHPMVAVISAMAKLSTSNEDMKKDKEFIEEIRRLETEEVRLIQYYMAATEISRTQREGTQSDVFTAHHTRKSTKLNNLLDQVGNDWRTVEEKRRHQWQTRPSGAWIREEARKTPRDIYEEGKDVCKRFGGCCAYSCGYCEKAGLSSLGRQFLHCSEWCECCVQRKGYGIRLDSVKV